MTTIGVLIRASLPSVLSRVRGETDVNNWFLRSVMYLEGVRASMLLLFPFCLALGFFLPGYFVARFLRIKLWAPTAFIVSLLILFYSVFGLGVFGAPISLWNVLSCLVVALLAAAWLRRRSVTDDDSKTESPAAMGTAERILLASTAVVGLSLLLRSAVSPLIGYDTMFRWDLLAQRIFQLRTFDFYPPLTAADFRNYFTADAIPPLVSFSHWWLYASFGRHLPLLISIFVAAQFVFTLMFTYGTASTLISRRAGLLAAGMLAASPLYFRAVVLGQETGLTALCVAATIYAITSADPRFVNRAMVLGGLAAGLCALSREYGWIAVPVGLTALVWRRQQFRQICLFVAVAVLAAGPWYARNWLLTGNPVYPLSFANLPVNPIYNGILEYYQSLIGIQNWTAGNWLSVLSLIVMSAPLQIFAGIAGGILHFRKHGYLLVITLLLGAVWIQSAGYTSGGVAISTRVLSPALVVLSIMGAAALERVNRRGLQTHLTAAVVLFQLWTAGHGVFYPDDPLDVSFRQWRWRAFRAVASPLEFQLSDQLAKTLPPRARVLSDNAYLFAALSDEGFEVVPVWSPEVRFLFSVPAEEAAHRLEALGIRTVGYYRESLNTGYLASASPFYAALPRSARPLAEAEGGFVLLVPGVPVQ